MLYIIFKHRGSLPRRRSGLFGTYVRLERRKKFYNASVRKVSLSQSLWEKKCFSFIWRGEHHLGGNFLYGEG